MFLSENFCLAINSEKNAPLLVRNDSINPHMELYAGLKQGHKLFWFEYKSKDGRAHVKIVHLTVEGRYVSETNI